MSTPEDMGSEREEQLRRTRSARRSVVAAGTAGALGAAIAIGATIHGAGSPTPATPSTGTSTGSTEDQSRPKFATPNEGGDDEGDDGGDGGHQAPDGHQLQHQQAPQGGQLAAPGGNAPAQGRSSGS